MFTPFFEESIPVYVKKGQDSFGPVLCTYIFSVYELVVWESITSISKDLSLVKPLEKEITKKMNGLNSKMF
jgi:hypothetical protein